MYTIYMLSVSYFEVAFMNNYYTSYVNISFPEILQLSLLLELQHLINGFIIFFASYLCKIN